jgi:hypothetical protein
MGGVGKRLTPGPERKAPGEPPGGSAPGEVPGGGGDLVHFKDLLLGQKEVFQELLGRSFQRAVTWADEVAEVRNKWGPPGRPL